MGKRQLVLEDGTVFIGEGFGSEKEISGEVVFNTSMTGYQEIITDPSYFGQIVTLTYPLIGNYGINREDFETVSPFIHGLVVKEHVKSPSNFRSDESINDFLTMNDIPGISQIDTRKLAKIIRNAGTMKGIITDINRSLEDIMQTFEKSIFPTNQVERTSTIKPYIVPGRGLRIVFVDFGMKHGILRELTMRNCHVTVVPYNYGAENILRLKPDGMVLSNGPGNPEDVPFAMEMIQAVAPLVPTFGICLGHQLLALAFGAKTKKLKFGHRGANHPVKNLETGRTYITSQNHGYAVVRDSLENTGFLETEVNINDHTVEGLRHEQYPIFSVQYHPESSPGPEDTNYLFDRYLEMVLRNKKANTSLLKTVY